jgi:hypothetical protein
MMLLHMRMASMASSGFFVGAAIGVVFTAIFHYCCNNNSLGDESYDPTEAHRLMMVKPKKRGAKLHSNAIRKKKSGGYEANKPDMQPNAK